MNKLSINTTTNSPSIHVMKQTHCDKLTSVNLFGFISGAKSLLNHLSVAYTTYRSIHIIVTGVSQGDNSNYLSVVCKKLQFYSYYSYRGTTR